MKVRALLAPATNTQRFADDCDLTSFQGKRVTLDGQRVGTVERAWVEDGSVYGDLSLETPLDTTAPSAAVDSGE